METKSEVRLWQAQDLVLCCQLAEPQEQETAWQLAQYQHSFQAGHFGMVVFDRHRLVGVIVAHLVIDTADLLYIQLAHSAKGAGIAQHLFQVFEARCRQLQMQRILLEVRCSNARAIAFYKKMHFEQVSIRQNYYSATPQHAKEDALVFELVLELVLERNL